MAYVSMSHSYDKMVPGEEGMINKDHLTEILRSYFGDDCHYFGIECKCQKKT